MSTFRNPLLAATVLFVVAVARSESDGEVARPVTEEIALLEREGRFGAKQRAFARLAVNPDPAADRALIAEFRRFQAGELSSRLWLDLFEAAAKRGNAELNALLTERAERSKQAGSPQEAFSECLEGGDGEAGRAIFTKKPEAGCIRCHAIDGEGGQIGPELTWLRRSIDRNRLLEAVILPSATMAAGFQSALLELKNGEEISGVISEDNPTDLVLTSVSDGKKRTIKQTEIAKRTPLPSPMPPHFGLVLTKREIRDLIEFLAEGD